MMGEINQFDIPSGFLEGVDAPVGLDLAARIHDWYGFEVLPDESGATDEFIVFWDDSGVDLDVYLYSAPDNETFGLLYLGEGQDLEDDAAQFERGKFLSGSLEPGSYLIGVHLPDPDQGPVAYGIITLSE